MTEEDITDEDKSDQKMILYREPNPDNNITLGSLTTNTIGTNIVGQTFHSMTFGNTLPLFNRPQTITLGNNMNPAHVGIATSTPNALFQIGDIRPNNTGNSDRMTVLDNNGEVMLNISKNSINFGQRTGYIKNGSINIDSSSGIIKFNTELRQNSYSSIIKVYNTRVTKNSIILMNCLIEEDIDSIPLLILKSVVDGIFTFKLYSFTRLPFCEIKIHFFVC
jgi:hypothetical protein